MNLVNGNRNLTSWRLCSQVIIATRAIKTSVGVCHPRTRLGLLLISPAMVFKSAAVWLDRSVALG